MWRKPIGLRDQPEPCNEALPAVFRGQEDHPPGFLDLKPIKWEAQRDVNRFVKQERGFADTAGCGYLPDISKKVILDDAGQCKFGSRPFDIGDRVGGDTAGCGSVDPGFGV